MSIRLVIFDLDGTLIDSRRDLADAANALVAESGGRPLSTDEVTAMVGEGAAILVKRALTAAGLDPLTPGALERFLDHYDQRLTAHTRPYEGIAAALEALRSERRALAILTNKPGRPTGEILGRLELAPFFSQVVGGDGPLGRKPDPAGLLSIAARAGVAPAEAVLVGDSPIDVKTARSAGAIACIAEWGFGMPPEGVTAAPGELVVDSPAALPGAIRSFQPGTGAAPVPETARSRT
jgi:phosphoglycolate phosphatase